jgi:hypothetical protein
MFGIHRPRFGDNKFLQFLSFFWILLGNRTKIFRIMETKIDWNLELWKASREGNLEVAKKAVANGADVNVGFFFR